MLTGLHDPLGGEPHHRTHIPGSCALTLLLEFHCYSETFSSTMTAVYLDQGSVQRDQEQGHPSHNEHTQHQTLASKHHSPLTGTLDNWLIQTWSRKSKMTQDRTSHVPDTKEEIQRWQGPVKRTQGPAQSRSPWWMSSKTEKDSDK